MILEELRKQVLTYAVLAERSGLCRHRTGNFSARDPGSGYICITPTGIDRQTMQTGDIVVMDLAARVIECAPGLKPTSEALMHLAAYRAREDVCAIAHTHSRFATSFAVLKKTIPSIVYEVTELNCKHGYVPVAAYGRPGTQALARSILEPLQASDAVLLERHGVLTVGGDLASALLRANYVEELAEIYYRTLLLGGGKEPPVVPPEELQRWSYPREIQLAESSH